MDHDLAGLIESPFIKQLKARHIKCYVKQLLEGLHYLHKNNVLHRDIKASNLLINNRGELKLADFGLARPISSKGGNYTNNVITLWYRPPELLLGSHNYKASVDCWSVGCILAELINKMPLFPGKNEIDQLDLIWRLCGTPTKESWPDAENLPLYSKFKFKFQQNNFRKKMVEKKIPDDALKLIEGLITLDPNKRLTAMQALDADYFWTDPRPCKPSEIPICQQSSHEYTSKLRNKELREKSRREAANGNRYDPRNVDSRPRNNNRHHPYSQHDRPPSRSRGPSHDSRRPPPQDSRRPPPQDNRRPPYNNRGYQRGRADRGPSRPYDQGRDYRRDDYRAPPRRGGYQQQRARGPEPQRSHRGGAPQPQPQRYQKQPR
mmetsp:Transcript_6691/g.7290  ORF Transcript_6691/g.7290 Transcript_6691/m.7290 type:complete len:377 (-) Transcript_6691:100-1230(-)